MDKQINDHIIKFDEDVTSFSFYNKVIPSVHDYLVNCSNRKLYLDFSDVEFVNPLVIPNILTLAVVLKNHLLEPAQLFIPWKPKLLSYLSDIGFIDIVRKYELFDIDERYIGDYETCTLKNECKTFVFEYGSEEENIFNTLSVSNEVFKYICNENSQTNIEKLDNLKKILTEICKNGCSHSKSMCFATMQTNMSKNVKFKKAYISISDCGVGYYDSIFEKISDFGFTPYFMSKDDFLKLQTSEDKDIAAILEAIMFRRHQSIYGMFDVISRVVSNDGVVRIHSFQTQLVFSKNNFSKYISNNKLLLNDFKTKYQQAINTELNSKYSNIRKSEAIFKGVHIEIEVPLL